MQRPQIIAHLIISCLTLCTATTLPAATGEDARLKQLDAYWAEVSRSVREGDFQGYKATCHPKAVIVSISKMNSTPLSVALARWEKDFTETKSGKVKASVQFRFSQRLGDETTAHETGMFCYTSTDTQGKRIEDFLHFEALLVKRHDGWKILMEYQKTKGTKDEWATLAEKPSQKPAKIGWIQPVVQNIEGWSVHIDPQLLSGGAHHEEGQKAIAILRNHLQRIAILVPQKPLKQLRKLGIWLEHAHPELASMQYHPGAQWLIDKGYDPKLNKMVHIPRAAQLFSRQQMLKHPAVILHELAHAYHDQVLDFKHPGILKAYQSAMTAGQYEKVLLFNGDHVRHYATTDHKEYFAEATESYFYRNDFFPFVAAELKRHDPTAYALMQQVWGALDNSPK
ncbi:MAG: hypothetical protein KJO21_06165 [Verrucomicrobiae bacterium]|nr:hypothetical protein [Verrucomicrobiae bacterium]NNJ41720.1 hypothetical protein [Akkermansiaceae bacterium]